MKVTTERLENCQVKMIVELDAADIDKKLRATARNISRQFNIPGYRRGKAPFHAVVRVLGREAVQQEALEDFGNELYEQALDEIEYEPYEMGSLEEVEWDPFRMTVLVPIPPEIDLGDYRSVRVPFEIEPVTEEQVAAELTELQQQYAQWVPVERPAALGDQVVLDMEGTAGDKLVLNNEDYEMLLQAEATYPLPGFHEEIVGMSPGEEKTFLLTVPEDDEDQDAAGQEATITVHLHTVKAEDLPPLDDELAMMVGDYDTLDALEASIQERLETEGRQKTESEYLDRVLEAMGEAAVKIEYPIQAIDREAEFALNQMERNLASSGIQLDTYLGMLGKTREAYKQELHPMAEERLKKRLIMGEVAKREGLTVEDEEIEAEIDRLSEMMGEQADQMRDMLESPGGRLSVADDLLVNQVQKRIVEIAKGEAPPLEEAAESEEETHPEAGAEAPQEAGSATEDEAEGGSEGESDQESAEPAPESDAPAEEAGTEAESESSESN
jgi:trigger factor